MSHELFIYLKCFYDMEPLLELRYSMSFRLYMLLSFYLKGFFILQITAQCMDRNFAYQSVEELHHPWAKNIFLGFARTSEFNGPRMPMGPHHLIEEVNTESSYQPMLELTHRIFGSSPPMQSFDPAKMLTVFAFHYFHYEF